MNSSISLSTILFLKFDYSLLHVYISTTKWKKVCCHKSYWKYLQSMYLNIVIFWVIWKEWLLWRLIVLKSWLLDLILYTDRNEKRGSDMIFWIFFAFASSPENDNVGNVYFQLWWSIVLDFTCKWSEIIGQTYDIAHNPFIVLGYSCEYLKLFFWL